MVFSQHAFKICDSVNLDLYRDDSPHNRDPSDPRPSMAHSGRSFIRFYRVTNGWGGVPTRTLGCCP
jgi:hypothetical protein